MHSLFSFALRIPCPVYSSGVLSLSFLKVCRTISTSSVLWWLLLRLVQFRPTVPRLWCRVHGGVFYLKTSALWRAELYFRRQVSESYIEVLILHYGWISSTLSWGRGLLLSVRHVSPWCVFLICCHTHYAAKGLFFGCLHIQRRECHLYPDSYFLGFSRIYLKSYSCTCTLEWHHFLMDVSKLMTLEIQVDHRRNPGLQTFC